MWLQFLARWQGWPRPRLPQCKNPLRRILLIGQRRSWRAAAQESAAKPHDDHPTGALKKDQGQRKKHQMPCCRWNSTEAQKYYVAGDASPHGSPSIEKELCLMS